MSTFPIHLQGLLQPGAYPHPTQSVRLVQTHISWILLTGEFAYKIKRPVRFPFIDLRSAERRTFLCHEEVRLNQRFAPELYLGVSRITLLAGQLRVEGRGRIIEHAVKMRQFPAHAELDHLLETGGIEAGELEAFGRDLARIHANLPVSSPAQVWGRPTATRTLMGENLEECARAATVFGGSAQVRELRIPFQARLEAAMATMSARFAGGSVRECHGDLHSRNIVRRGSRLVAFDCLEFEPAFRWIDVADEIAFLLADLRARQHLLHAQAFLGGYLTHAGDYQVCRMLGLYEAHRSLVLAKITALSAVAAGEGQETSPARRHYEKYLDCAQQSLSRSQPILILMCGLSGSGKTWIASHLAPLLNAVHLRSDVERKRLVGIAAAARSGSALEQGLYSSEASARVYQRLLQCAGDVLAGGFTAIVDATFGRREDRAHFRELSVQLGVAACIVHCQAPSALLRNRITTRSERGDDASEADLSVLLWQETHREPISSEESFLVFETTSDDDMDTLARRLMGLRG